MSKFLSVKNINQMAEAIGELYPLVYNIRDAVKKDMFYWFKDIALQEDETDLNEAFIMWKLQSKLKRQKEEFDPEQRREGKVRYVELPDTPKDQDLIARMGKMLNHQIRSTPAELDKLKLGNLKVTDHLTNREYNSLHGDFTRNKYGKTRRVYNKPSAIHDTISANDELMHTCCDLRSPNAKMHCKACQADLTDFLTTVPHRTQFLLNPVTFTRDTDEHKVYKKNITGQISDDYFREQNRLKAKHNFNELNDINGLGRSSCRDGEKGAYFNFDPKNLAEIARDYASLKNYSTTSKEYQKQGYARYQRERSREPNSVHKQGNELEQRMLSILRP
ncbi:MAG: hypothetical protein CMM93_07085 [Rickettsiales bacterium]|nr:hypothetical protein [Rickettsiales bacterium]|tara:strand:- start:1018 stop:2016 length:999 start_codon:yes stop_codon:yes gene_type:complete